LLQRQLDESRKLLTEAAVRRKVMEKLKEKRHDRWKDEIERKETAQTDEIGMQLAFRELAASHSSEAES
jgi:flagellar export protein FliJ